jgi:hypothetical protein
MEKTVDCDSADVIHVFLWKTPDGAKRRKYFILKGAILLNGAQWHQIKSLGIIVKVAKGSWLMNS